jgi:hypothetical protein
LLKILQNPALFYKKIDNNYIVIYKEKYLLK